MRKPSRARPIQPAAQITREELERAIERLGKRLADVQIFEPSSVTDQNNIPHAEALAAAIDETLVRTFGADTLDYRRYSDAAYFDNGPFNYAYPVPISQVHASLARSKARSAALLSQAIEALKERVSELPKGAEAVGEVAPNGTFERKVFIVHGHDEGAREGVARFLERIGFEAVILHERANRNRTLIEKVEAHGDVGFAVVLLTPDDEGCVNGGTPAARARQNVVLELGYFVGRLGRDRVCVLKRDQVEIPSDFAGVVYEPFDDQGAWKPKLARELKDAGYEIDWAEVHK